MVFIRNSNQNTFFLVNKNGNASSISDGAFLKWALAGQETDSAILLTIDSQASINLPNSCTLSRMVFFCTTGTLDAITPVTLRVIGLDVNQIISIPALSGSVTLQDTTNLDVINNLDGVNYGIDTTLSTLGVLGRIAMSIQGNI